MAKKRKNVPVRGLSKKQSSKWDRERRLRRLILIIGVALIAVIVAIPAFGYYQEEVAKYQIVVAKVNDKTFTSGDYLKQYSVQLTQKKSMLQYWTSQITRNPTSDQTKSLSDFATQQANQLNQQLSKLDDGVLDQMIEDEILRVQAPTYGISVTGDEIQAAILQQFQAEPKEGESPEEAAKRQADFQANYKSALNDMNLSEAEFTGMVQAGLLRDKMQELLAGQVANAGEQVHLYGILSGREEDANTVLNRMNDQGIDFKVLASQMSIDNSSSAKGGDMGWVPYGVLEPSMETVAFSLSPGQVSDPIKTEKGYWIIKVEEKANKEIDPQMLEVVKAGSIDRWLFDQKNVNKIERNLSPDLKLWAYERTAKNEAKKAKQQRVG